MPETKTRAKTSPKEPEAQPSPPKAEPAQAAREHACNVAFCPIGLAMSTVQGAAPEVMEHLLKAASEFLLAARAVIDNRAKDFEDARDDHGGMTRIEIS